MGLARLREHHDALGAARRMRRAEHRHATAAHARQVAHGFLELVGTDVAAAADDDVFLAPGDVHAPFGEIGTIAGVHPVAVEQSLRGLRIAVVAAGGGGPAELKLAFVAIGELEAPRIDHA